MTTPKYAFGNDEFSIEAAYHDCKLVFDGITDDDSFQEADTGLILYYANEIIYALHKALEKVPQEPSEEHERKKGEWQTKIVKQFCAPDCWYPGIFAIEGSWNEKEGSWLEKQGGFCSECGKQDEDYNSHNYCPLCGIKTRGEENATR